MQTLAVKEGFVPAGNGRETYERFILRMFFYSTTCVSKKEQADQLKMWYNHIEESLSRYVATNATIFLLGGLQALIRQWLARQEVFLSIRQKATHVFYYGIITPENEYIGSNTNEKDALRQGINKALEVVDNK